MKAAAILISLMVGTLLMASAAARAGQMPPDRPLQSPGATPADPGNPAAPAPAAPPTGTPDQANSATYPTPSEPGNGTSPAQNADPHEAASQHRRDALRTAAASGNTGSISPGMHLQTKAGQSAGSVVALVPAKGRPQYVVVADHAGQRRAMTYQAARLMVHGNSLIVDEQRLQGAPPASGPAWQAEADRYWGQ